MTCAISERALWGLSNLQNWT